MYNPERIMGPHERAATKLCKVCKVEKPATDFSLGRRTCKECRCVVEAQRYRQPGYNARHAINRAAYYKQNRAVLLKQKSEYGRRPDVSQRDVARRCERYEREPEFRLKSKRRRDRYYRDNPHVFRARDAQRRALKLRATPPWADLEAIKRIYKEAQLLTKITGIKHVVDHIIPLKGRTVSGLHVENNLQVITERRNLRKFNRLVEDIVQTT